jgi:hypothetical protein
LASAGAHAALVNATLDFTLTTGGPTPSGDFVFDTATNQFTSFLVQWDGNTYDFASKANADSYYSFLPVTGQQWCGIGRTFRGVCVGTDAFFLSFDDASEMGVSIPAASDLSNGLAAGTYDVTCRSAAGAPVTCPASESNAPESTSPLLLGLGLLWLGLRGQARRGSAGR